MRDAGRRRPSARCTLRLLLAPLVVSACIQAPVAVEVASSAGERLASLESFALVPPPWPHPEVGPRIEEEIRASLEARGLREAPVDEAQLAVNYRAMSQPGVRTRSIPDPDVQSYRVRERYIEKTVEIDVFDAQTYDLLWRGIGRIGVVSRRSLPAAAAKATREILYEYPRP